MIYGRQISDNKENVWKFDIAHLVQDKYNVILDYQRTSELTISIVTEYILQLNKSINFLKLQGESLPFLVWSIYRTKGF